MKRPYPLLLLYLPLIVLVGGLTSGCAAALQAGAGAVVQAVEGSKGPPENELASQAQSAVSIMWGEAGSTSSPLSGTYQMIYKMEEGRQDTLYMRTLSRGATLLQQTEGGRVVAGHWLRGVAATDRQQLQAYGQKGQIEAGKTFPAIMVVLPREQKQRMQWYNTIVGVFPQPPEKQKETPRIVWQAHHRFLRELGRARQGRTNSSGPLLPGWLARSENNGAIQGRQGRSWGDHPYQLVLQRMSALSYQSDMP